jgi:hypothetical protein
MRHISFSKLEIKSSGNNREKVFRCSDQLWSFANCAAFRERINFLGALERSWGHAWAWLTKVCIAKV